MEQRNLILAIALSIGILLTFQILFASPPPQEDQLGSLENQTELPQPQPQSNLAPQSNLETSIVDRNTALSNSNRVEIFSPRLRGTLSLKGARFDDIWLEDYRESLEEDSPQVVLLSPTGTQRPYYAEFGWAATQGSGIKVPDINSQWVSSSNKSITPNEPIALSWDNGQGQIFTQTITIDENYMFKVTQSVTNNTNSSITLFPYARIVRTGTPKTLGFFVLHEGPIGVFNEALKELSYDDVSDEGTISEQSTGGWIGITDKYWLVAIVPDQTQEFNASFRYQNNSQDQYQTDVLHSGIEINPGSSSQVTNHLFAGAKEVDTLEYYNQQLNISRFDLTIDWGWLFFLTKPIFLAIDFLYKWTGNFGVAIIIFTIFVRLLFYPLANKSFRSFGAMRKVQPEVVRIREMYKDDRERMSKEMMELYKREKVNPLSGCMPLLLQIPVFFALYKVLFVTIEMRHSPFYGWIQDLSAPDPTSLFNLFGLIPWDPPSFLVIGIWPLLMGISMFVQQKLNPAPPDPIQARIFMLLPIVFTVILAGFPAGLVIYWTVNNVLSMAQQWVIMRRVEKGLDQKRTDK